jgi:2-amino-4-hydroxy-6-hydroxymethyldihydropteridine diphosphokinase/dihydropteroate synthase
MATGVKSYIALGSNLGDRRANLERAAQHLSVLRASPILETSALVLPGSPPEWRSLAFYNAVIEIAWSGSPRELLKRLKQIENEMGRVPGARWAPRLIDLDILTFGELSLKEADLEIPHPEINNRAFVLMALKHLAGADRLRAARALKQNHPLVMGIINLTPDSFSDGGEGWPALDIWDQELVSILDLGAESTRPGATSVSAQSEWRRLQPALEKLQERYSGQIFRPWVSVDTYHPETAERAIACGADMINDVSGLRDEKMLACLAGSSAQYVLMHSLTIPADPKQTLASNGDVVAQIYAWARQRLRQLDAAGVDLSRVLFDPGIGFGKTPLQSEILVREIERFMELPVRILVGHSRKSFLGERPAPERDPETLGLSLQMVDKGVDVIRVHAADLHRRVLRRYLQ